MRFSTEKYAWSEKGAASLHNQYMHLTNYSINKHSAKFVQNHDASEDDTGSKWSLSALRRHLARCGVDVGRHRPRGRDDAGGGNNGEAYSR